MNILPFVLVLILILSVVTIEKLEKFKSLIVVQKEYQFYLAKEDRQALNKREKKLYDSDETSQRQLTFRPFFDKALRDKNPEQVKQIRLILVELMRVLYGEANFFKKMEIKRPHFLEELLNEFIAAADRLQEESQTNPFLKENKIRQIEDIVRVKLEDPELQQVFYHMLKGTVTKARLKDLKESDSFTSRNQGKSYLSLLNFIHNEGKEGVKPICIRRLSRELLRAIFGKDEIAEAILARRKELNPDKVADATGQFTNEFKGKQRPGISDELLDFELKAHDTRPYD